MSTSDTRESIATNAAAWVLHHGYDDEDDTSDARIETDDEQQIELARQVARRVLRHVDSFDAPEPANLRGPIHEALKQVESSLRGDAPPGTLSALDAADVIRRALQEIPFHHDECDVPEDHVVVATADLRTIVDWEHNSGGPFTDDERAAWARLKAALPRWEPDPDLVATVASAWNSCLAGGLNEKARAVLRAMHAHGIELPEADS